MKVTILDENLKEVDKYDYLRSSEKHTLKTYENVPDINEKDKKLFNNMNYIIGIFSPTEKIDDFYISFLNERILKYLPYNLSDIKGSLLSDLSLDFDKNRTILNSSINVYNTGQPKKCYINLYDNDILYKEICLKIIKIDNFIHILGNYKKEEDISSINLDDNLNRLQSLNKTFIIYKGVHYYRITPDVFEILEIDPNDPRYNKEINLDDFIIKQDLKTRHLSINSLSPNNPEVLFVQRVKTAKGNIKYIKTIIQRNYDNNGNLISSVSYNQDITDGMNCKNQLETTLKNNETLLSEIHHRVNNNLQIITSLINMNMSYHDNPINVLENVQNNIQALSFIYEIVYESPSLSEFNLRNYINSLVSSLFESYESNINLQLDMDSMNIDTELAVPIGLIINEFIINTIKHGFPDKEDGKIYINFKKEKNHYTLIFKDDGIGLPDNFDINNISTIGLILVNKLVMQIEGKLSILDCKGTGYKIEFDNYA